MPPGGRIVVEHRGRLACSGVEQTESALVAAGWQLVVVEAGEQRLELVPDFVDTVTAMCARR